MMIFKRHKKLIIVLSVVLLFLITLIVLMFTLFSLKNVEISYSSTSDNISQYESEIKAKIDLGGTVFFKDKNEISQEIEKTFPYVKVVNIETIIPNKFVLHLAQRQEMFAIKITNGYAILDDELKILKIISEFENDAESPIILNLFDFNLEISEVGSFLSLNDIKVSEECDFSSQDISQFVLNFYVNCQKANKKMSDLKAIFKDMQLTTYKDYKTAKTKLKLTLHDFNNFELNILECNARTSDKIAYLLSAYAQISANSPQQLNTHKLTVYENSKNEIAVILEEK